MYGSWAFFSLPPGADVLYGGHQCNNELPQQPVIVKPFWPHYISFMGRSLLSFSELQLQYCKHFDKHTTCAHTIRVLSYFTFSLSDAACSFRPHQDKQLE